MGLRAALNAQLTEITPEEELGAQLSWEISKEMQGAAGPQGCFRWEKGKGGFSMIQQCPSCQGSTRAG